MKRQVIIYPGEDGYWVAECASLPACISLVSAIDSKNRIFPVAPF